MDQENKLDSIRIFASLWIMLGISIILMSGLFTMMVYASQLKQGVEPDKPFLAHPALVIPILQIVFGTMAIVGGIQFKKLNSWGRSVLEILSLLSIGTFASVLAGLLFVMLFLAEQDGPKFIILSVVLVVLFGLIITPFGFMLRYLRGEKVRNAVAIYSDENKTQ